MRNVLYADATGREGDHASIKVVPESNVDVADIKLGGFAFTPILEAFQ